MDVYSDLKKEIESAITALGMSICQVSQRIIDEISHKYVIGNPRVWWLSLVHKKKSLSMPDNTGYKHIQEQVKEIEKNRYSLSKKVYFIVDDDGQLYGYKILLENIVTLIESCRYFEYYVVASDYSWLICENDHGLLIVCYPD